jgi:hypothetical protein
MKDLFKMYYVPDQKEFEQLWSECIFIFDANVLLNLYRYSNKTTEIFQDIIKKLSKRIWIPHQVALEYQANRVSVIYEQQEAYNRVRQGITKASSDLFVRLEDELKSYKRSHPVIDVSTITSRIDSFIKTIHDELEKQEKNHPNYIQDDSIRQLLEEEFLGKIGTTYNQQQLTIINEEGEKRYKRKQPPGFKDAADKKDKRRYHGDLIIEDQYGDLIVWKQIIDKALAEQMPVIFVTDDAKEDWWQKEHGKTVGPRVELLNEFTHKTEQKFYMYESYRFIEYAQNFLQQQIDTTAIQEVQDLKESKEREERELSEGEKLLREAWKQNPNRKNLRISLNHPVKYKSGERVFHDKWGKGVVISAKGEGSDHEVRIAFPAPIGIKRFLAKFAPIKRYRSEEINDSENDSR